MARLTCTVRSAPGAADESLRPLLAGATRPASVLAMVTEAVHLQVESALVVVCGPTAVRLPGSVILAQPVVDVLDRCDPVTVGCGRVEVGDLTIVIRRWTAAPRPRLRDLGAAAGRARGVAERLPLLPPVLDGRLAALSDALADGSDPSLYRATEALIGLGPGLTPAGDDVVAGAMLTLYAIDDPRRDALAAGSVARRDHTTAISAALLDAAAAGRCIPQAARFVAALDGRADLERALAALLTVGHTSGAALAAGIVLALSAAADTSLRGAA